MNMMGLFEPFTLEEFICTLEEHIKCVFVGKNTSKDYLRLEGTSTVYLTFSPKKLGLDLLSWLMSFRAHK